MFNKIVITFYGRQHNTMLSCCDLLIVTRYQFIASKSKVSIPNRNGTKQQNLIPKI